MKPILLSIAGIACAIALLSQPAFANDRFIYSANSPEVTDSTTGLIWRRCSEGQVSKDTYCAGKAAEFNYKGALAIAARKATRKEAWRVPTVDELSTLAITAARPVAIDVDAFPDTAAKQYMSSTTHDTDATQVMVVYFNNGHIFKYHRNNKAHVRLVR